MEISLLFFSIKKNFPYQNFQIFSALVFNTLSSELLMVMKPRLRSRLNLSYDQTIQTEITSDQTFRPIWPLIRLFRQNDLWSNFPEKDNLWSDGTQTMVQTIVRFWSDSNSDHCPDYKQNMIRPFRANWPLLRLSKPTWLLIKDYTKTRTRL